MGIGFAVMIAGISLEPVSIYFSLFAMFGGIFAIGCIGVLVAMNERRALLGISILLLIVLLGIQMKRWHWPGAGLTITLALVSLAIGYYFLTFKFFYTIKNNNYLKIVSAVASFFIATISMATVFKFQHWPGAGFMIQLSLLPSLIFTMIVLITLPGSGYIQWEKKHKDIFTKKLLLPWMFFLLFAASVLLIPKEFSRKIFTAEADPDYPFFMEPYDIGEKEGLEPGQ